VNPIGIGIVVLPVLLAVVLLVRAAVAPVSRTRLERFARRQQLVITPANGNRVITYLATTRRWRSAGVLMVLALFVAWIGYATSVRPFAGEFTTEINVLHLVAGWFVGAVIAEARLAGTPTGPVRLAALQPRDPSMYLPRYAQWLVPGALVVSVAVGLVTFAQAAGALDVRTAVVAQLAALVVAAAVWVVSRHVLARPQPVLPPDELAADDAIRSRALHVLAGSGTALVLYAVIYQLDALSIVLSGRAVDVVGGTAFVLVFVAPLIGWLVATRPWPVRRDAAQATVSG
jgi:hypothetical protein